MTLSDEINRMIETQLKSAVIISPRFSDYRVSEVLVTETPELEEFLKGENEKIDFLKNITKTTKEEKKITTKEEVEEMLNKVGIRPENLSNLLALTSGKGGLGLLTRFGGIAGLAGPLGIGLLLPTLTESIIKELQRPGGFLDKRVKIDARNEAFAELDRQTRQNTRIGDRQVIVQQFGGFRNFEGFASTNTSRMIRENADRVLDIGLFDRAQGV